MNKRVDDILNEKWAEIVDKPHFVCALAGCKEVAGVDTGEECVVVYVTKKIVKENMDPADLIPVSLGELPTDVREGIPKMVAVNG